MLVGIKYNVDAIGKLLIRVHGHSFKIMTPVNTNTNLSIFGLAKIQIGNTTTKFDYAVFVFSSLFGITNHHTISGYALRCFRFEICSTSIFRKINNGSNIASILNHIRICYIRTSQNSNSSIFSSCDLFDIHIICLIALLLKHFNRSGHLLFGYSKMIVDATSNVDIFLFVNRFLQNIGSSSKNLSPFQI